MSDDIPMQDIIDYFNQKSREAKILAKAEAVASALQSAQHRIAEADALVVSKRKQASLVEGESRAKIDLAHAELSSVYAKLKDAESQVPQAAEQAAKIVANAQSEAATIKANAEAFAASVMSGAQSRKAHFDAEEASHKLRAQEARRAADEEIAKLEAVKQEFAKTQSQIKKALGL